MDDINGFSKYIKVFLNLKDKFKGDSSKKKNSFVCVLCRRSVYPGYIQTGILYPNANNESDVSFDNTYGSVIEICGYTVTGLGFNPKEYQLDYIEVNYETTTCGKS